MRSRHPSASIRSVARRTPTDVNMPRDEGNAYPFPLLRDIALWRADGALQMGLLVDGDLLYLYERGAQLAANNPHAILDVPGGTVDIQGNIVVQPTNKLRARADQGTSYLYVGSTSVRGWATQREWLFDVSEPDALRDVTPQQSIFGYWGWYYQDSATGFTRVAPRVGVVRGDHFYRGAWSVLDVHRIAGNPPSASFDAPDPIFGGTVATLRDSSTGGPTSWKWDLDDDGMWDAFTNVVDWMVPTFPVNRTGFPGDSIPWENWSHGKKKQVLTRGSRTGSSAGARAGATTRFTVGSNAVHCSKDWMHAGDPSQVGSQAERDSGHRAGLTTSEREELSQLKRENRELKRANEILRKASAFFAQAELDRRPKR